MSDWRLAFVPHASGEREAPPLDASFVGSQGRSVSWSQVQSVEREEGYLGLSSRVRVATGTGGGWLVRVNKTFEQIITNLVTNSETFLI